MNTGTDTFLSTVDRFSQRLGLVNSLVTKIVDRFAPQATARAGCAPIGYEICRTYCEADIFCCGGVVRRGAKMVEYAINISTCESGNTAKCFDGCSDACGHVCG